MYQLLASVFLKQASCKPLQLQALLLINVAIVSLVLIKAELV